MNVILTLIRDTKIMWPAEYYELLGRMLALRTALRFWCYFSGLSSPLFSSPFRSHSNALQGGSECLMRLRQKTCSRHPVWDRQRHKFAYRLVCVAKSWSTKLAAGLGYIICTCQLGNSFWRRRFSVLRRSSEFSFEWKGCVNQGFSFYWIDEVTNLYKNEL